MDNRDQRLPPFSTGDATPGHQVIRRLEDIPEFASDGERTAFWDNHSLSEELWERMRQGDPELERLLLGGTAEAVADAPGAAVEFVTPALGRSGVGKRAGNSPED
ncbi:hypothetical protein [Deinococcus hopiensis]|uniref:Uncharacterized protein n=1 Tax=Deinococcus hopiensis KR-140 TaxID=695939 RepID=A0A1W1UCH7_9DEIO|nr:hypothetical protein [Deinococcus hopiensis]SMB78805.1 hypothetical protein SAMN00790413_05643 [Deinococcus hopiensis KR-140]